MLKNKKLVISIILIVLVASMFYVLQNRQSATQKLKLDIKAIKSAQLGASGEITILDKEKGEALIFQSGNLSSKRVISTPKLIGYDSVLLNTDASKALAAKYNYDYRRNIYTIIDLTGNSLDKKMSDSWYKPKWSGKNEIYYTQVLAEESLVGIYRYDLDKNTSSKIIDIEGDTEDDYAILGDQYLIYRDSSTDASPVNISVYDLRTNQKIKELTQALNTQFLFNLKYAVFIGENILVISAESKELAISQYPVFTSDSSYAMSKGGLIALDNSEDYKQARVGGLSWLQDGEWKELNLRINLARLGYLYQISANDNELLLFTETGVYQYILK